MWVIRTAQPSFFQARPKIRSGCTWIFPDWWKSSLNPTLKLNPTEKIQTGKRPVKIPARNWTWLLNFTDWRISRQETLILGGICQIRPSNSKHPARFYSWPVKGSTGIQLDLGAPAAVWIFETGSWNLKHLQSIPFHAQFLRGCLEIRPTLHGLAESIYASPSFVCTPLSLCTSAPAGTTSRSIWGGQLYLFFSGRNTNTNRNLIQTYRVHEYQHFLLRCPVQCSLVPLADEPASFLLRIAWDLFCRERELSSVKVPPYFTWRHKRSLWVL